MTKSKVADVVYRIFLPPAVSVIRARVGQDGCERISPSLVPSEVSLMRIAKPILLVTTPLGLLDGFYECYKLAGGLLFLMVAMVGVMVAALGTVIATIRREERQSKAGPT
jgi:hypothetical protein